MYKLLEAQINFSSYLVLIYFKCVEKLNEQRKEYKMVSTNKGCLYELNLAQKQKCI